MTQDRPCRILHLDMDAFFASVEQADNPELKGKPVIVGGEKRGVVSACSYEARTFGIHSAMPSATARRLCPHGVFLPGRMHRYAEISRQVMAILGAFSPLVEQASVDEAYLDITGCETLFGPPRDMALRIKTEIRAATALNCSIGIAPVKFLAKIASDYRKPDGLFILEPEDVPAFLLTLPVAKIPGVGKSTQAMLAQLGVTLTGDILRFPRDFWERRFGKTGLHLYGRAQGMGSTEIITSRDPKSDSAENTFPQDTRDTEQLHAWLLHQAERVGRSLRSSNLKGRTVTLKIKFADFRQITRSHTLAEPTNTTRTIFQTTRDLLAKTPLPQPVRLLGTAVSNFANPPRQLSLLDDLAEPQRQQHLDAALDEIQEKYGRESVVRGRLPGWRRK